MYVQNINVSGLQTLLQALLLFNPLDLTIRGHSIIHILITRYDIQYVYYTAKGHERKAFESRPILISAA